MNKFEFLQKIDSLKDCADESRVLELYKEAEDIFEEYDDEIQDYKSDISRLAKKNEDLDEEIECLEKQVEELESDSPFILEGVHDNIVTKLTVENLFENLDHIPVAELESFINKYKPQ